MQQGPVKIVVDALMRLTRQRVDAEMRLLAATALGRFEDQDGPTLELKLRRYCQATSEVCGQLEQALCQVVNVYRRFCGSAGVRLILPSFDPPRERSSVSSSALRDTTGRAERFPILPPFRFLPESPQDDFDQDLPDYFEPR